jgi:3-deoxy-manno-octulosonate cytidylyltransferase (CMP-KDO synthetase)
MVVRVAQRALSSGADQVVVACDDASIQAACSSHGISCVLTKINHPSGSDRLAEACDLLGLADDAIVVNVQGDEPMIDPQLIKQVADSLKASPQAMMGTAAHTIESSAELNNPNVVKLVVDRHGHALYFSRSLIPYNRDQHSDVPKPLRHVGIYSYRTYFLRQFPKLSQAPIEISESLEQLRVLWHGHKIAVYTSPHACASGVDTPEDLEKVRKLWLQLSTLA